MQTETELLWKMLGELLASRTALAAMLETMAGRCPECAQDWPIQHQDVLPFCRLVAEKMLATAKAKLQGGDLEGAETSLSDLLDPYRDDRIH